MGRALNGARKILATTPSRLPENEENVPFKTDYLKTILCQGYAKNLFNVFMNQGHCFYVMYFKSGSHQVVAVARVVARVYGNERLKRPKRLNMNGNATTLRPCAHESKTKHGFLAKPVVEGTLEGHPSRGVRGHAPPGKFLKSSLLESLW